MTEKQPRSGVSRTARPVGPDEPRLVPAFTRYDLLLAAIGLLMLCAVIVAHVSAVPLSLAVSVGAVLSVPLLVDGLAINPPA